jgi:hypothetical protein
VDRAARCVWAVGSLFCVALMTPFACSASDGPAGDGGHDVGYAGRDRSTLADGPGDVTRDASLPREARRAGDSPDGTTSDSEGTHSAEAEGPPSLTALSVTTTTRADAGDASAPLGLVPSFSPNVYDYYVRCAAGANALMVAMTASPGADSALVRPTTSPSRPTQTLSLSVMENQAIVAIATSSTATVEYWVRCLPHDFPPMKMVTHPEAGVSPPGYYLLGTAQPDNGSNSYAIILDGNGVPVWYVAGRSHSGVGDIDDAVSGAITFFSGVGFPWQIHQLEPLLTTYAAPVGAPLDLHEFLVLSNGDFLVTSDPLEGGVDLTGLGIPLPDGGSYPLGKNTNIALCDLVEFEPLTGAVVWTWHASDHLDPVMDTTIPTLLEYVDGAPVYDVYHCNSIDIDPSNGNLLVSARDMDSVFYVDRSSGKILWKMGGLPYTVDDAPFIPVTDPFFRQHDARLQPGWSTCTGGRGQISMFDDESYEPEPARAVVYDVVVGAGEGGAPADGGSEDECGAWEGGTRGATVAWQYKGTANSSSRGSFRVLSDGSRVIGWGQTYAPQIVFTEVNINGDDLVDFYFTDSDESYRVIKVPLNAFDLGVLRNTAGVP